MKTVVQAVSATRELLQGLQWTVARVATLRTRGICCKGCNKQASGVGVSLFASGVCPCLRLQGPERRPVLLQPGGVERQLLLVRDVYPRHVEPEVGAGDQLQVW